jgi:hypothetical protein
VEVFDPTSTRDNLNHSNSESYVTTNGQSASLSWNITPIWGLRPDLDYSQTVAGLLMWGVLSDERTGLSFLCAAGPCQRSVSRVRVHGTWDLILLSQIWDFPFRRLLRLAGSRWRYSTPPPHGGLAIGLARPPYITLEPTVYITPFPTVDVIAFLRCCAFNNALPWLWAFNCWSYIACSEPEPLCSNGRIFLLCLGKRSPSRWLAMDVCSNFTIPAVRRHVTI